MLLLGLLVPDPTDDPTIYRLIMLEYIFMCYEHVRMAVWVYTYIYILCYKSRNVEVILHIIIIVHRLIYTSNTYTLILCKFNKNNNNNYTFLRYIYIRLIDFIIYLSYNIIIMKFNKMYDCVPIRYIT